MHKMASNKHTAFGNGEKLLRCAGSLFPLMGLSLIAKSNPATHHGHTSAHNPRPQLPIVERGTAHSALPTDAPLGPMRGPPNLLRSPSAPFTSFFHLKLCNCSELEGGLAGFRVSYLMVAGTSLAA